MKLGEMERVRYMKIKSMQKEREKNEEQAEGREERG